MGDGTWRLENPGAHGLASLVDTMADSEEILSHTRWKGKTDTQSSPMTSTWASWHLCAHNHTPNVQESTHAHKHTHIQHTYNHIHTEIFKNEDNNSNIYSGMLFDNCIKIKYANPVQSLWLIVCNSYHWDLTMLALFARNISYVILFFFLKQTCRTPAEQLLCLLYVFPSLHPIHVPNLCPAPLCDYVWK